MKRSTSQERAAAWAAYDKRMGNYMTTKSDRNLPAEQTEAYKYAAKAIVPEGFNPDEYTLVNGSKVWTKRKAEAPVEERSLRYNSGKADYSLIPMASMQEAARVLEYGATKYAVDNWKKPTNWRVSYACLMRHMSAWQDGEDLDPESQRNHLGHAMCNILQMLHMLENHPEELER